MAKGGYGLPKVLLGPAMPYPSALCGWATPETAFRALKGWSARRVGGLRPSSIPLDTPFRPSAHVGSPKRGPPGVVNTPLPSAICCSIIVMVPPSFSILICPYCFCCSCAFAAAVAAAPAAAFSAPSPAAATFPLSTAATASFATRSPKAFKSHF
jgi:hypothetical protein